MKIYEMMCVFSTKENRFAEGLEAVKTKLKGLGAEIEKEDDIGDKELAYMLGKETRGHYYLFTMKFPTDALVKLDEQMKLQTQLMRYLVVRKESRPVKPPRQPRQRAQSRPTAPVEAQA
ncbi:MAG: 30S ribosomal protein S6 [Spirochaetia bacterium]